MNLLGTRLKTVGLLAGMILLGALLAGNLAALPAGAATSSQSGAIGLQGTIPSNPPGQGATIAFPANGAVFSSTPITVSGICPSGLLIKVFDNNVFVGSTVCANGSYSVQIDLFSGQNQLVARDYDALDQAGPDSNMVTVTLNNAALLQTGTPLSLSSNFAERGAAPGTELDWPIILNGGTAPYAISVDWGDGSPSDLFSETVTGPITLKHTYKESGIYKVVIKATDKNGQTAFLQLVGQATGAIQNNNKASSSDIIVKEKVLWWPAAAMLPLILLAFWAGRRHELDVLRKRLDPDR